MLAWLHLHLLLLLTSLNRPSKLRKLAVTESDPISPADVKAIQSQGNTVRQSHQNLNSSQEQQYSSTAVQQCSNAVQQYSGNAAVQQYSGNAAMQECRHHSG
jgi:hypothetical protein